MSGKVAPIAAGFHTVTPRLVVPGCADAIAMPG